VMADGPKMPPLSKMAPMIVMLALSKFDLEALGLRTHCEAAFFGVQIGCFFALTMIESKIKEKPEDPAEPTIKMPAEVVMGNEAKPAKELSAKDYDLEEYGKLKTQQMMGAVILGVVYYNWRSLMPLVLQALMTPLNLYESPLFQMYLLGKTVKRPFPKPNPFGFPEAPPAEVEEAPPTAAIEEAAIEGAYSFIAAEFGTKEDCEGTICRAQPLTADTELANQDEIKGKVVVVARGVVTFFEKAKRAVAAGAVGIIVINDEDPPYKCTAPDDDCSGITVPIVCVGRSNGAKLSNGTSVSMVGVAKGAGKVVVGEGAAGEAGSSEKSSDAKKDTSSSETEEATEGVKKTAAGKKKSARE